MGILKNILQRGDAQTSAKETPQKSSSRQNACFVLASPRSGTTWLMKALNTHPQIFGTENRLFGMYADLVYSEGAGEPRLRVTLDKYIDSFMLHFNWQGISDDREVVRKSFISIFIDSITAFSLESSGKSVLVDKITPYPDTSNIVAASIGEFAPHSKIISLVRDGRDVLTSGVFHWLNKSLSETEEEEAVRRRKAYFLGKDDSVRLSRLFCDKDFEEWCTTWRQPLEQRESLKKHHPLLNISYEEMSRDFGAVLPKIFKFLGVEASDEIVSASIAETTFKKMSGGRERGKSDPSAHVRKGIVGDWKNYFTRRDGELFNRLAGEYLIKLGYEKDESWVEALPESLDLY